jgi:transcriptional regulator with XRE-family HTH domain
LANLEAQAFSVRLAEQLKTNGHPVSATYIALQIHVTPHAARLWLTGVNIPKEQNMQALAKWLKVDPRWLRCGGVLEDSFITDYMSLSEEDKATVRAVVGVFWRGGIV